MNENQLQEFNPTVAELTNLAESYKWLKINWVEDKEWFEKVKQAKKDLSEKRNHITKTLKAYRENAIKFQKDVISKEKELVGIIEPVEDELKRELERINQEIEMKEREAILPMRIKEITEIWYIVASQSIILWMNDNEFMIYCNELKAKKYEEQKLQLEKIEREKQEKEEAEKRQKELDEAKEKARIETEQKAEQDKIEAEKRHQEEIERLKIEQEQKIEREKQAEIQRQKDIENGKLFQEFLESNWYNENTKNDFFITYWDTTTLYKKIATFTSNNQ